MSRSSLGLVLACLLGACVPPGGGGGGAQHVADAGRTRDRGVVSVADPDDGVPPPDAATIPDAFVPPDPDDGVPPPDARVAPTPDDGVVDPDGRVGPPPPDAALDCDGPEGCVTTIYAAHTLPNATRVTVEGVVTGVRLDTNISLQIPPAHPDYDGADFSGIWVYVGNAEDGVPLPERGLSVRLTAETNDRFGQRQLHAVSRIRVEGRLAMPPARRVAPADIATEGDKAAALEGALVEVVDVVVIDADPEPGPADAAEPFEFVVTGGLRVDDFLYRVPTPPDGARFDRIAGVLRFANNLSKIEPRDAEDVEGGPVVGLADGIVVNEVDYDQAGVDAGEFVELYNAGDQPVALAGVTLELFNGNDLMPYETFALGVAGAQLAPRSFLVMGPAASLARVPPAALRVVAERDENLIQNGPDGVRVVGADGAVIDSVGYGADVVPGATEGGANAPSDPPNDGGRSLARCPDGADSDRNASDFRITDQTPGRANACR